MTPQVTFVLKYTGVAAKYDGFSGNEPVQIEGTVKFKAPIDQYGRVAMYAKEKRIVLKDLKKQDQSFKEVLKLAKDDVKIYGDHALIKEFVTKPLKDNESWLASLGKKVEIKDRLEYEANKTMYTRQGTILEALYAGPESDLVKAASKASPIVEDDQDDDTISEPVQTPVKKPVAKKKATKKKAASKPAPKAEIETDQDSE